MDFSRATLGQIQDLQRPDLGFTESESSHYSTYRKPARAAISPRLQRRAAPRQLVTSVSATRKLSTTLRSQYHLRYTGKDCNDWSTVKIYKTQ